MNRRSFLSSILAAGAAPAICNVEWLMRGSGVIVQGRLLEIDFIDPIHWAGDLPKIVYQGIFVDVGTRMSVHYSRFDDGKFVATGIEWKP